MTHARPPLPLAAVRAFVASGRLWLCEVLAWLAAALGVTRSVRRELIGELNDLHRAVALLVFAEARNAVLVRGASAAPAHRPHNAPPGFARGRDRGAVRVLWRSVPRGVGLQNRIAALAAAIDAIPALAARFAQRMIRRRHRIAVRLTAAPCDALAVSIPRRVPVRNSS